MTSQSQYLELLTVNTVELIYIVPNKVIPTGGTRVDKTVIINQFPEETESKLQKIIELEDEAPSIMIEKKKQFI